MIKDKRVIKFAVGVLNQTAEACDNKALVCDDDKAIELATISHELTDIMEELVEADE